MEQRSARTTQHDPHERYGTPPPGEGTDGDGAAARRGPRLPHPAAPAPPTAPPARKAQGQARGQAQGPAQGQAQGPAPGQAQATAKARPSAAPDAAHRGKAAEQPPGRQRATRRGTARKPQGGQGAAAARTADGRRRGARGGLPTPRLTGLGVGVFASLLMVLLGGLVSLMPGGAPAFYGIGFVLVAMGTAVWVRPADLLAAPIAAPLAYTAGLFFAGGSGDGFTGVLQNVFTGLALHAVWLYAGTLAAVVIVLVRKAALGLEQRRARRRAERA
ncbi:DUF6542 domain-containing protein [Streptomyces sp. 3N207]|uniref:DUF6542 domain-containing protein n=1 Tax=Streptomyces sp. 3N207 TaxID=3457417 RepID=UPI003FCF3361